MQNNIIIFYAKYLTAQFGRTKQAQDDIIDTSVDYLCSYLPYIHLLFVLTRYTDRQ